MAMTEEETSSEPLKEGWVPANHLEKLISRMSLSYHNFFVLVNQCGLFIL